MTEILIVMINFYYDLHRTDKGKISINSNGSNTVFQFKVCRTNQGRVLHIRKDNNHWHYD